MFWFGIVIALVAGIISVTTARSSVQSRFPWIRELHLDIASLVLLVIGLALSAIDHVDLARELFRIEQLAKPPVLTYAKHEIIDRQPGNLTVAVVFQRSKAEPAGTLEFEVTAVRDAVVTKVEPGTLAFDVESWVSADGKTARLSFATSGSEDVVIHVGLRRPSEFRIASNHLPEPVNVDVR